MITKFEVGKYYRYLGIERWCAWRTSGEMDMVLDHEPHLCTMVLNGTSALFEGMPTNSVDYPAWSWSSCVDRFELVGEEK